MVDRIGSYIVPLSGPTLTRPALRPEWALSCCRMSWRMGRRLRLDGEPGEGLGYGREAGREVDAVAPEDGDRLAIHVRLEAIAVETSPRAASHALRRSIAKGWLSWDDEGQGTRHER
jgi:hypothetical protein